MGFEGSGRKFRKLLSRGVAERERDGREVVVGFAGYSSIGIP